MQISVQRSVLRPVRGRRSASVGPHGPPPDWAPQSSNEKNMALRACVLGQSGGTGNLGRQATARQPPELKRQRPCKQLPDNRQTNRRCSSFSLPWGAGRGGAKIQAYPSEKPGTFSHTCHANHANRRAFIVGAIRGVPIEHPHMRKQPFHRTRLTRIQVVEMSPIPEHPQNSTRKRKQCWGQRRASPNTVFPRARKLSGSGTGVISTARKLLLCIGLG